MPTVSVISSELFKGLGETLSYKQLEDLCFAFGLELDGEEVDEAGRLRYRIEAAANRVDLLSVEGISVALKTFMGKETEPPNFVLSPALPLIKMTVKASTATVRPYGFAAVLRGVRFTAANYESFIDFQDKLHHNIGRRRQLVAIGTHDLSTLKPPFVYAAEPPAAVRFRPLTGAEVEVDGRELMEVLSTHAQLRAYLPIIRDSPLYPVIRDSNGVVLSLPPIINSDHSKISLDTTDVFIEITATDRTRALATLNNLVCAFSQYASKPFHVEPVLVEYEKDHPTALGGRSFVTPCLERFELRTDVREICKCIGTPDLSRKEVCACLCRMMVPTREDPEDDHYVVSEVPVTRTDVLHPCDLTEDVAIAYGYNKISPSRRFPYVCEQPYMALSHQIRSELANCGCHEALNWGLVSLKEGFEFLQRDWRSAVESPMKAIEYDPFCHPVRLVNPKAREFEIVRSSLLPGLLKTLAAKKAHELPLRLFEIGDVVCIDPKTETKARTSRYCALLIANHSGCGLEHVHGLLDVILMKLGLTPEYHELISKSHPVAQSNATTTAEATIRIYKLLPCDEDQAFLQGRCVRVVVEPGNVQIGVMGALHPKVLKAFNVTLPSSVFELSLEPFLQWLPPWRLEDE